MADMRGLAWAVLCLAPASFAATTAVIAVDDCEHAGGTTHARVLRDSLGLRSGMNVQAEAETLEHLGGAPHGSISDAERLLSGGRGDMLEGNLARAERDLAAALEDLRRLPPTAERWGDISEAQMLLGWLALQQDKPDDARRAFARVLRIDPA